MNGPPADVHKSPPCGAGMFMDTLLSRLTSWGMTVNVFFHQLRDYKTFGVKVKMGKNFHTVEFCY